MSIRILLDETGKRHAVPEHIFRQLFGDDDADVVPEGGSVRVPTLLRDGQPPAADPRFNPLSAAQLQAVADARAEWIERTCNAWKGNAGAPPAVADSTPRANFPTRSLLPQPPPPRQPVHDEREQAYNEYCDYLRNAWKAGKEAT